MGKSHSPGPRSAAHLHAKLESAQLGLAGIGHCPKLGPQPFLLLTHVCQFFFLQGDGGGGRGRPGQVQSRATTGRPGEESANLAPHGFGNGLLIPLLQGANLGFLRWGNRHAARPRAWESARCGCMGGTTKALIFAV